MFGILHQCANGKIGFSSPVFKTRSKQVIEEKWGNHSNVPKTIVSQGIEVSLGYCANGPMNIGKSYFEGGMTTYAQKCKTAEICKRKSAG